MRMMAKEMGTKKRVSRLIIFSSSSLRTVNSVELSRLGSSNQIHLYIKPLMNLLLCKENSVSLISYRHVLWVLEKWI